jgi:hypothetical protein
MPSEDVAIALGHQDGGNLVRRLYGHRDNGRALDRIVGAYATQAAENPQASEIMGARIATRELVLRKLMSDKSASVLSR